MSVDLSGLTLGLLQGAVLLVLVYVAANPTRIVNAVSVKPGLRAKRRPAYVRSSIHPVIPSPPP